MVVTQGARHRSGVWDLGQLQANNTPEIVAKGRLKVLEVSAVEALDIWVVAVKEGEEACGTGQACRVLQEARDRGAQTGTVIPQSRFVVAEAPMQGRGETQVHKVACLGLI